MQYFRFLYNHKNLDSMIDILIELDRKCFSCKQIIMTFNAGLCFLSEAICWSMKCSNYTNAPNWSFASPPPPPPRNILLTLYLLLDFGSGVSRAFIFNGRLMKFQKHIPILMYETEHISFMEKKFGFR